jgi:shikimate kinase
MGAGKSTVGRILARLLGFGFVDVDSMIEQREGVSIARIFAERGEPAFRDLEAAAIAELAARQGVVVAAGGGAPIQERNRSFFAFRCRTFLLEVSLETALARASGAGRGAGAGAAGERPLLEQPLHEVRRLYGERLPLYRSLGEPVDTESRTAGEAAREIVRMLGNPRQTRAPGESG